MIDSSQCEKELPDMTSIHSYSLIFLLLLRITIWPGEVDEVHMTLKHDGRGQIVKTSHQHFLKQTT